VLRQLLSRGALATGEYQSLHMAGDARQILKGEVPVHLRVVERVLAKSKTRTGSASSGKNGSKGAANMRSAAVTTDNLSPKALERLSALKAWRIETARAHGVPAYVIFHDAVLVQIAEQAPGSREELAEISGIGVRKLDAYGPDILTVLARLG
jgi:ATP-dependent DNA helicase RecQ